MTEAFEYFVGNFQWMGWNLFLAIIPCVLSFILFARRSPRRLSKNPIWWFGLAVFILFLPNAPYIITDIIHFVDNATTTGGSNASHVDGPIRKTGNDAFNFPTGDGGFFSVIQCLGKSVFQYLKYYDKGRFPM